MRLIARRPSRAARALGAIALALAALALQACVAPSRENPSQRTTPKPPEPALDRAERSAD